MLGLVLVDLWVGIVGTHLAPDVLDLVIVSSQVRLAGPTAEVLCVLRKLLGAIPVCFKGDRVHEHICADSIAEQFLNLHEVLGCARSYAVTIGVHEIDQDGLSSQQIVIETDGASIVSRQLVVGEVALHPLHLCSFNLAGGLC